jgi:drug/metabolite transporter (DMT)-like permease
VDVVFLALVAGVAFAGVNVSIQMGYARYPDIELGGVTAALIAIVMATIVAAATRIDLSDVGFSDVWPFLVIGIFVPGASQILYVHGIRLAGASRTGIVLGTSPLLAALLALVFLDEPFSVPLAIGTLLIVAAGVTLAYERARPANFRALGIGLALGVAIMLAFRDNLIRRLVTETDLSPIGRSVALLAGCCVLLLTYIAVTRGPRALGNLRHSFKPFWPAGIFMGIVYIALIAALDRGKVTIVAPLNGTNALWTVVLAAIFLRRTEAIGPRLVLAAVLTVAGSALVTAFR